jgi:hypothetical protein
VIFAIISGFPTVFPKDTVRQGNYHEYVEKTADMDEYIP